MAIDTIDLPYLHGIKANYPNGLTQFEMFGVLNQKINEIVTTVNNIDSDWTVKVDEKIHSYSLIVNEQLQELKDFTISENSILDASLRAFIVQNVEQLQLQLNNHNVQFDYIANQLVGVNNLINTVKNYLINYVDSQNQIQDYQTDVQFETVNKRIDNITESYPPVYNPTNGLYETVNKVLTDLYNVLAFNSITAFEFDTLGVVVEQFDNANYNVRDFDINAKQILGFYSQDLYMINPFTGIKDLVKNVVSFMADKMKNGAFTVAEFDALLITTQAFDDYHISAYNFDFNGKNVIV